MPLHNGNKYELETDDADARRRLYARMLDVQLALQTDGDTKAEDILCGEFLDALFASINWGEGVDLCRI